VHKKIRELVLPTIKKFLNIDVLKSLADQSTLKLFNSPPLHSPAILSVYPAQILPLDSV